MNDQQTGLAVATLIAIVVTLMILAVPKAHGGEKMLCNLAPQGVGEWHYRTKIGGRREQCWYIGERMKPRSELYWAEAPAITPMTIMFEEKKPSEFELRWKGE